MKTETAHVAVNTLDSKWRRFIFILRLGTGLRDVDIYFDVTVRRCDIYDSNHWRVLNPAGPLLLRDEQQIISVGSTPPLSTTDLF